MLNKCIPIELEFNELTLNHKNCRLLVVLKVIFANSVDPDQTAPLVYKNRFKKFARIFGR